MIFPSLTLETTLQVEDKTRLDASDSFITSGEVITDVLIQSEASEPFISVFNVDPKKWHLDWAYLTEGIKTVVVKVLTDVTPLGRTRSYLTNVISEEDDVLFSDDSDLISFEPDIKNYLKKGKNTYIYAHRKAQDIIISYLDEQRIWKSDGSVITKQDIAAITDSDVKDQFRMWSTFQTLLIVFESIKVSNEDIFSDKKRNYKELRDSARNRSSLRLDLNGDNTTDIMPYDIRSLRLIRR